MGTGKNKDSKTISKTLSVMAAGLFLGLLASCTQGGGGLAPAPVGGPVEGIANPAAPADNTPVLIEADPEGDCSRYFREAETIPPEEVPEICMEIYERGREVLGREPIDNGTVEIPERIIPTIAEDPETEDPDENIQDLQELDFPENTRTLDELRRGVNIPLN